MALETSEGGFLVPDGLAKTLREKLAEKTASSLPLIIYGVWVPGVGWLRDKHQRSFGDLRVEYAQAAAEMRGDGSVVRPIDESMELLEEIFLEQEKRSAVSAQRSVREEQEKKFINRVKRFLYGIFRPGDPK